VLAQRPDAHGAGQCREISGILIRGVLYRPGDTARKQKKKSLVSLGDAATRLYTPGDVAFSIAAVLHKT
jgi:hypothetical protein